jgi:LasA protease
MKVRLIPVLLAVVLLTACADSPSLWGTYDTPTPNASLATPGTPEVTQPPLVSRTPPVTSTLSPTVIPSPTATATPLPSPTAFPTPSAATLSPDQAPILYYSQSGDTLPAVASHFGVDPSEISPGTDSPLPPTGLIDPGTLLIIPNELSVPTTPDQQIMPDSEVVYSATALDFDTNTFVREAGGHLSSYSQYLLSTGWTTGADAIQRLAMENSINPRLLLAMLEHESHWVFGEPQNLAETDYPMGYQVERDKNFFSQMAWATEELSVGYYSWRQGTLTELTFSDGTKLRIAPKLNAGTVALQYFFSLTHNYDDWGHIMDPNVGFPALYTQMFGDPWARAQQIGPLFPRGLKQPTLVLPFEPNREWNLTGGPHAAWEHEGPIAAIDLAPSTSKGGCDESEKWLVASAPGLVVRSENGVVMLDLDFDGYEQTGWDLLYLHVATKDRVPLGTQLETDQRIGHASCEGGEASGTHLHFARKYNGEWVLTDGPMPFVLSGWTVHNGDQPYEGTMTKGDQTVTASPVGSAGSSITRSPDE